MKKKKLSKKISIILTFYTLQDRMGEIVYQMNGYDVTNYRLSPTPPGVR